MKKAKKCETEAIYTRVSSRGQEEDGYSLEVQLKRAIAYAMKNNNVVVFEKVESARSPAPDRTS
ncbi:hypothetical protein EG832_03595 [bacterium]|nr:hypothetical protein [bacterium]